MKLIYELLPALFLLLFLLSACNSDTQQDSTSEEFERIHGVGPVTEPMDLDDSIDSGLAKQGFETFEVSCAACHMMRGQLVGPPLNRAAEKYSPEFLMNFFMNPQENFEQHPNNAFNFTSENDARAMVEYLRYVNITGNEVPE